MSVGQKLVILKIRSTSVTFLSLPNLEAAPEEAMQLKRLIKSSNESLGPYLSSGIFRAPELRYQLVKTETPSLQKEV